MLALVSLGLYFARERTKPVDTSIAANPARDGKKPRDGWMPWIFGGNSKGAKAYRGPKVAVTVKVVDMSGSPVAGVEIEAKADLEEYEVAGMTDEEYEEWLERTESEEAALEEEEPPSEDDEWVAFEYATVETGRTDRDGIWIAKVKPDISVVFHARDGDGREGVSPTIYVYGEELEEDGPLEVTIEIAEIGVLVGTIVDPRGTPIEGADVTLTSWSADDIDSQEFIAREKGAPGAIRTAADGRFRVELRASGAFDVEVHAKRHQPVVEQAVQVLPGRETAVSITMMPSAEIGGIVLDPAGQPLPDARVVVQGQPQPGSFVSFETSTDEGGRFVAEELAPGKYVVAASYEGFRPAEAWNVEATRGEIELRLTRGGAIDGTVIADASLLAQLRAVVREPDDWEILEELEEEEAKQPPGELSYFGDVYLAHAGADDELIPIATGVPRDRIPESPSGVVDSRGRYFAQVRIGSTGRGGFRIRGLPTGTYVGTVMLGTAIGTLGTVRVHDNGTTQVTITLPDRSGGSITGTVRSDTGKPVREGTVFLYGGTMPSGMSALVREDGRFEFSSVPAGDYMIHAVGTIPGEGGAADTSAFAPARPVSIGAATRTTIDLLLARERDVPIVEPIEPPDIGSDDWGEIPTGIEPPEAEDLWAPDVWIEEIDGNLVVTWAPPGPDGKRLFGGDRVMSIDGTIVAPMESWEALELLYGPQGSICTIVADRPATRESVTVSLPRTRASDEI